MMTRECVDSNHCEIEYNRPYEETECTDLIQKAYVEKNYNFWIMFGIILAIVLLIILVNIL
jgi:hypothetical protein